MAKARIVYVVDDKELKELQKELNAIKKKNKEVAEGFGDSEKEIKKTKTSLVDLKGMLAGLGLAGLATAAIVSFAKLNKEINKTRKEVAQLTGETGLALDKITAKIRATSQVFEKDFNEVLRSANAVSKQLGITMTESMDEINDAMARGLDINGEYLETIKEYSPFMKQAGIDFRQFNILIQKQITEGVFSDKGIDAIKEAVISIQEMTPATEDALKAVGFNTKQITKDLQSGAKTYFDIIQDLGKAMEDITDPRIRGQVLADVFRGAGEDAGDFALTLHEVGTEYGVVTEEQQKYIDSQVDLIKATEKTEEALVRLTSSTQSLGVSMATFWQRVKGSTLESLEGFINLFKSGESVVEDFSRSIGGADKAGLQSVMDSLNQSIEANEKRLTTAITLYGEFSVQVIGINDATSLLNEQLAIAEERMEALEKAEIAEAAAADFAKIKAEALAEAKINQAKAADLARQAAQGEISGAEFDLAIQELDLQSQINDEKVALEQKLQDDLLIIKEEAALVQKEADELQFELDEERQQNRIDLIFEAANQIADIHASFSDLRIQQIQQELTALEFARNRELDSVAGSKEKEAAINAKFDAKRKDLQQKQLNQEKAQAIFGIAINTAQAIVKGIAMFGPPPSPVGIAAIIAASAIGLLQTGLVLGQKVPEFGEGVLDFRGNKHSQGGNIVNIEDHESVMTAMETDKYYPTLKAIRNKEISPEVLNALAMNGGHQVVINDYDKLAQAVLNQPQKNIIADASGFTGYILDKGNKLQLKQAKYKM